MSLINDNIHAKNLRQQKGQTEPSLVAFYGNRKRSGSTLTTSEPARADWLRDSRRLKAEAATMIGVRFDARSTALRRRTTVERRRIVVVTAAV